MTHNPVPREQTPDGGTADYREQNVDKVARAMVALGAAYRGDWSNFDGRTLRDEMNELAAALAGTEPFDLERWYVTQELCPERMAWAEYCDQRNTEEAQRHYMTCDHLVALWKESDGNG